HREVGDFFVVIEGDHLRMIAGVVVLHDDIAAKNHGLAVGRRVVGVAEIVVAHKVALVIGGAGEPIVFEGGLAAADVEVLALDAVVEVAVAHGEIAAIDVNVVGGRRGGSLGVAIGVEFAELDDSLAVLGAASDADIVGLEKTVLDVEVGGGFVITDAAAIDGFVTAMAEDNP